MQPSTNSQHWGASLTCISNEAVLDEIIARKGLPAGTRRINGGDYVQARLQATYPKKG